MTSYLINTFIYFLKLLFKFYFYFLHSNIITFLPFLPFLQTLSYTPSHSPSNSCPLIHELLLHEYMYIEIHNIPKYSLLIPQSVACLFSGMIAVTGQSPGVLFPGEDRLSHSCSWLSLVAPSSLCRDEGSLVFPHSV